jgi:hypothetical protein
VQALYESGYGGNDSGGPSLSHPDMCDECQLPRQTVTTSVIPRRMKDGRQHVSKSSF